jgi:hypothetical protein
MSFGYGCKLNPNGNTHVHGVDYNPMIREALNNVFLLKELNKPISDFDAFKLKIINQDGIKIKEPVTEQEKAAFTPGVQTILKIKKYLGSKLDLINNSIILEQASKLNYNRENHIRILALESKIEEIYEDFCNTVDNALTDGITLEQINAILNKNNV